MPSSTAIAAAFAVSIRVAPDVSPELSAAAVRSCEAALGAGQCRSEPAGDAISAWHATVTAGDPDPDSARVEIRRGEADPARVTRNLSFAPEDAPRERWASTGVLIAALIVAEERKDDEVAVASPPAAKTPPPVPRPPLRPEVQKPSGHLRFDVRGLLARRLERGAPEIGAEFGASFLVGEGPWFGAVSLAGADRYGSEPDIFWASLGAAVGLRLGGAKEVLAAEVKTGGVAEYWGISASRAGRSEGAGVLRLGGVLGADGLWSLHPQWILSLGVEGRLVMPRLSIDVAGAAAERVPGYGALMFVGLRFAP